MTKEQIELINKLQERINALEKDKEYWNNNKSDTNTLDGKALHIADVIGSVALHIHYDLSIKAMRLMKENDTMKVEEFRELPEVKKLWGAMDVIKQHYL